ncbi:MAG: hypothetical protein CVU57_30045 [Deltaproteobacteria bacterium HGW-Deltaproteobacteria-15]|nr:MAG: hypothetical protein CVU57_30045 [Deltaproteobacteria bacterium HGW-Deltaproteobacteria-15]
MRNPSVLRFVACPIARIDGFRFALPILQEFIGSAIEMRNFREYFLTNFSMSHAASAFAEMPLPFFLCNYEDDSAGARTCRAR